MTRNSHRAAEAVVKAYLSQTGTPFVPDDPRMLGMRLLPEVPFDLAAFPIGSAPLGLVVRSSNIKGNEKWSSTTHTYLSLDKVLAADEWSKEHQVQLDPYVVYVMETVRPQRLPVFEFADKHYHLVAVPTSQFRRHARPRASDSWGKVQVSSTVFEAIAVPLQRLVKPGGVGVAQ